MPKDAELRDLQNGGQAFYEAIKYSEALDAFSKAIAIARKWSPQDLSTILDQRMAVHVKLGNNDLARKDAVSMIRPNKSNGRGYLRCGQLDRLEDNPAGALRWYEHGLKQVSEADPLRSTLIFQREKTKGLLDRSIMSSNSRDPVSTLPMELFQLVVTYIDYIDAVRALRVSKVWKENFSRVRPLVDTIDFSDAKRIINYKMMVVALKRLGHSPKVLIMNDLAEPATDLLRMNLERWRNYTQLEGLVIPSTVFGLGLLPFEKYSLKSLSMVRSIVRDHMVIEILKACKKLETARFANVRGTLSGHGDASWVDPLLCPSVRVLSLGGGEDPRRPLDIYVNRPNVQ